MPGLLDIAKGILAPIHGIVDDLHTSGEEKLAAQRELFRAEHAFAQTLLEHEAKVVDAQSRVVIAEAQGQSWLQRNWRPLLMLTIVAIVANNYLLAPYLSALFGVGLQLDLPEQLWQLMTIGVGGYIVGRTGEKITATWASTKRDEE